MSKKIVIISSSLRKNSNSEALALAGSVFAGGVTDAGSIDGHAALQKAYEMGKNA